MLFSIIHFTVQEALPLRAVRLLSGGRCRSLPSLQRVLHVHFGKRLRHAPVLPRQVQEQLPGLPRGHVLVEAVTPRSAVRARHPRPLLPEAGRIRLPLPHLQEDGSQSAKYGGGVGGQGTGHRRAPHACRFAAYRRHHVQRLRDEESQSAVAFPRYPVPAVQLVQHRRRAGSELWF